MSPAINPVAGSGAANAANYQGIPQSMAGVLSSNGTFNNTWYQFFQALWLQVASGTSNSTTLQGVYDLANTAQQTASAASSAAAAAQATANTALTNSNNNATAIAAETARAEAAEANLQTQINNINTTLTSLQTQINTINTRLANAGIP